MAVFVLDRHGRPLMPCSEKRARLMLERQRARVHRVMPFVIRLTDRLLEESTLQPVRIKIEPGSKITGLALVREDGEATTVLNLFELVHRGRQISESLSARSNFRRRRRSANLRYRAPHYANPARTSDWLPPSLRHRVDTTKSWVTRFIRWAPVSGLANELVRYDLATAESDERASDNKEHVEITAHEMHAYLLDKWGRQCVYCDSDRQHLQIDPIDLRTAGEPARRISGLVLACTSCIARRAGRDIGEFVTDRARLERLRNWTKAPQRDRAAVDGVRSAIAEFLATTGLPVELSSGGRTKWNRTRLALPKLQALDAACVGAVRAVVGWRVPVIKIKCTGRGRYQRTLVNAHGFPRGYLMRNKRIHNVQTGDRVRATVPTGKKAGIHTGRVAVRSRGYFDVHKPDGPVTGIHHRYCVVLQRADGYSYSM